METTQQRAERIARLEHQRAQRKADGQGIWPTPDDVGSGGVFPVEIAPGRGDLNYSSGFVPTFPTALSLIGRTVSFARLFQSQPWVAAAVLKMMSWAVRVPLKCYERLGDDPADRRRLRPEDHPLAAGICAPWNRGSQAQFVHSMLGPRQVHGNAVIRVDSGASDQIRFSPKDWRFTRPIMMFRDSIEGFTFNTDAPAFREDVTVDKVLHVATWSPIGPIGTSPLQQLGITLNIEDAAQRYQEAMLRNGGRPPTAITTSAEFLGLEPAERQKIMAQLRADVIALYGGPENAGRPALLPPGLDWKPVGQTTVEAELIEQRKITREEVCAVYLIPPPLMGILDRATYSNIQVQRDMTYTDVLGPPLVEIEQAINAQVARDLLKEPEIFVEFDFAAVLRGDRLQEIDALRDAIASALMTPNEGRGVLNLRRSEDPAMDEFYLPQNNLQPIMDALRIGSAAPDPNRNEGDPELPEDTSPDPQRGQDLVTN